MRSPTAAGAGWHPWRCPAGGRSRRRTVLQEGVDGSEQGRLLAARQALDLLHAAQELAAGLVCRFDSYRLRNLKQFLHGNIEGGGEANRRFRKEPRLAVFIVGDHNLNSAEAPRQFLLAESPQLA